MGVWLGFRRRFITNPNFALIGVCAQNPSKLEGETERYTWAFFAKFVKVIVK